MAKHTPGPWRVISGTLGAVEAANGVQVANAEQTRPVRCAADHDERKANARLIAAAPELLEALKGALEALEFAAGSHEGPITEQERTDSANLYRAHEAIAKAEGK